jgi:DNA end-binding protein Ku
MDALRRSVQTEKQTATRPAAAKKGRKKIAGQREMLLPIAGKKTAQHEAARGTRTSTKHRKAG